eukprot:SAG22_NODE_7837_length_703_cov_1.607616_2_plen_75_part_01
MGTKKKKKAKKDDKELQDIATRFTQKMEQAFNDDKIEMERGQPALEKLSLLPMVRAQMKKQVLREKFLYASPPVL